MWNLTKGDLVLSYTVDLSGVTQAKPYDTSYTEVGIRQVGADDFNPGPFSTYQGGAGGWMTSLVGDLTPSPGGLSLMDKNNLGASGGRGETDYDTTSPFSVTNPGGIGTTTNYGIWFDRDSVDPYQATYWGSVDGATYNTGGVYDIVVKYHAINDDLGTMFATVNGVQTGFYTAGWQNAQPGIYPAGLSFKGDMTNMQAFAGLYAPDGAGGDVHLSNIQVQGTLVPEGSSLALLAGGVLPLGLGLLLRRRAKR